MGWKQETLVNAMWIECHINKVGFPPNNFMNACIYRIILLDEQILNEVAKMPKYVCILSTDECIVPVMF